MVSLNVGQASLLLAEQNDSSIPALINFAILVAVVVGMWLTFQKAGKPGWAAVIPIYNLIVLLQIADKPWWWVLLLMIPIVNLIMLLLVNLDLAEKFGKGDAFAVGLTILPFIFFPILGLGDTHYQSGDTSQRY